MNSNYRCVCAIALLITATQTLAINVNEKQSENKLATIIATLKSPPVEATPIPTPTTTIAKPAKKKPIKRSRRSSNQLPIPQFTDVATDRMLNKYYHLKETNPVAAQQILQRIIAKDPNNTEALKEMGYLLLKRQQLQLASSYFVRDLNLEPTNYDVIMQVGDIYDTLKERKKAYYMYQTAAHAPDLKLAQRAKDSMIYTASAAHKIWPAPWFSDIYMAPQYQSRFRDYIFPIQLRTGVAYGEDNRLQIYGSLRYTRDSRSSGGLLPDIYEDNSAIFAAGISYRPILSLPVNVYMEYGYGYDLFYRDRHRWREDLREGITSYINWGAKPVYASKFTTPLKPIGDFYGDISYSSRDNHNLVGQLRLRQGLRMIEWCNSSLDLYLRGQYLFDTKHEYYNNITEYGLGVAFTPYNPWNLVLHVERIWGHYLAENSPDPNPYGNRFNNTIVTAEYYIRF